MACWSGKSYNRLGDKMQSDKVVDMSNWRKISEGEAQGRLPPGSGGGDNGDMETRVRILEQNMIDVRERLARMETRLDQTATKNDLIDVYKAINTQTWRVISAAAALVAAVYFIVRYLPPAS